MTKISSTSTNFSEHKPDDEVTPLARRLFRVLLVLVTSIFVQACVPKPESALIVESDQQRIVQLSVNGANSYAVVRSGVTLLIDAGNPGDADEFERLMRENNIDPESVRYLLLTHGHKDHAGNVAYFSEKYGTQIIASTGDIPIINQGGRSELCPTSFMAKLFAYLRKDIEYSPFSLNIILDDAAGAYSLTEIGFEGDVLTLPGHTPGSVVILSGEHAFVGDLIRGGLIDPEQPETHLYMCDLVDNREKIKSLIDNKHIKFWHPGHGGPLTVNAVEDYWKHASNTD